MTSENKIVQFTKDIAPYEKQFKSVLPAHIDPKKFIRTVVGAIQNNPEILACDRSTIYSACQNAARDGLILDGREAALVKYNSKKGAVCQYMPMVAGILKKLRNSKQLSSITAQIVREKDSFSFNPAMDDVPNHKPDWFGDRGKMIGVYAVARMKDGATVTEIMNITEIESVRICSMGGNDRETNKPKGIWLKWYGEMARKTVLRRIAKFLPSSADIEEVQQIFEHDNENFQMDVDENPVEIKKPKSGKTRAAQVIEAEFEDVEPDAPGEQEPETQQETDPI